MFRVLLCVPCCTVKPPRRKISRPQISENVLNQAKQANGLDYKNISSTQTTGTQKADYYSNTRGSLTNKNDNVERGKDKLPIERIIETRYLDSTEGSREISDDDHRQQLGSRYSNEGLSKHNSISKNISGYDNDYNNGDDDDDNDNQKFIRTSHISSDAPRNRQMPLESRAIVTVTSTSRIGDYARLEYSPVDDSESDGTNKLKPGSSNIRYDYSKHPSELAAVKTLGVPSGFSSPGIESSISIASQLSNEYLEQNLTKALETALQFSDTQYATIGLPLGPPYFESTGKNTPETGKTSPETMGAVLTSADSLSRGSQSDVERPKRTTDNENDSSTKSSIGAALVGVESPLSQSVGNERDLSSFKDKKKGLFNKIGLKKAPKSMEASTSRMNDSLERPGSSASMKTTDRSDVGSPTPSQMSKGSVKKVVSLAKGLFKKKKKNKDKDKDMAQESSTVNRESDSSDNELEASRKK